MEGPAAPPGPASVAARDDTPPSSLTDPAPNTTATDVGGLAPGIGDGPAIGPDVDGASDPGDGPAVAVADHADLVKRDFTADAPDRLWVTDLTQHRTSEGWVYCAVVLDVFSRRVVGWSVADHLRTELVVDALEMARWRRKPTPGSTVLQRPIEPRQYTSWLFGSRLGDAGLMGSMGAVGSAYDNALMESFFGRMQIEFLDRQPWRTRTELANAILEWIESFYNPVRQHSSLGHHSPLQFEQQHHNATVPAACSPN